MKLFTTFKSLFTGKNNRDNGHPVRDRDQLDHLVHLYLGKKMLGVSHVPEMVEFRFYKTMLRITIDAIQNSITKSSVVFLSHRISMNISPALVLDVARKKRKRRVRTKQEMDNQREMVSKLVARYIDNFPGESSILPAFVEKRLYINVIDMVVNFLQDTLHTACLDVMGHRLDLNVKNRSGYAILSSSQQRDSREDVADTNEETEGERERGWERGGASTTHSASARAAPRKGMDDLDTMVDAYMSEHKVFPITDFKERHLYRSSLGTIVGVLTDIVQTSQITLLDHVLSFDIVPQEDEKNNKKNRNTFRVQTNGN